MLTLLIHSLGDVVRIAPNELVFVRPPAFAGELLLLTKARPPPQLHQVSWDNLDLYGSHTKYLEHFVKTDINNHGNDEHGGLIWEWDPVRHRQVAKQLSPAFSGWALKAKEPTLHHYIDLFVQRMQAYGGSPDGVSLPSWTNWLCVDISTEMAYNRQMNALQDSRLRCSKSDRETC